MPRNLGVVLLGLLLGGIDEAWGQAPGVTIESNVLPSRNPELVKQAAEAKESGTLLTVEQVREALDISTPAELSLPPARTRVMSSRSIATMARAAYLRVGWYFRNKGSERWELNLTGGYAITADGVVATCFHCIEPAKGIEEGGLVAVDSAGKIRAVTKIVAANRELDACLVQVAGEGFQPLPLSDRLSPGDAVYCFSDPYNQTGYFSAGITNRFYWQRRPKDDAEGMAAVHYLRLNVSTDWAPGSSGAAVIDAYGNAVGHVARIRPLTLNQTNVAESQEQPAPPGDRPRRERTLGPTVMIVHEAIPARGVMALARGGRVESTPASATPLIARPTTPVEPPKPTLEIGMNAPKLQAGKFVQGEPVTEFATGTAYIVEFWATWCGPCITSIPHLNELHQKFVNQGLVVIGQDIWQREDTVELTEEAVRKFLDKMGEKMTYRVALDEKSQDDKGAMARTWMEAAGQNGIPSAFIVGKDGKIAWIGHPMRLTEQMLSSVLDGSFDVAAAKKEFEAQKAVAAVMSSKLRPFILALNQKKYDEAEKVLDEMTASLPEGQKHNTDRYRLNLLLAQEKWDDAAKTIDAIETALPDAQKSMADRYRFDLALKRKDGVFAATMAEKIAAGKDVAALTYNDLAWRMLIAEGLENLNLALCEQLAQKSIDLTEGTSRANVIDTLARVRFLQGQKEEAIKLQEQAIEQADERQKAQMQATLEAYKKGEVPKGEP